MLPRHPRRTLRFAIGALLLAPVLGSCGFDYATDRINTLTPGTFDRSTDVDVLNAVVVTAQPGSGTLNALLVNNKADDAAVLNAVTTDVSEAPAEFEPLEVPGGGSAQLTDAGIRIDGDFDSGDFIDVTLTFLDGDEVTLEVPVYPSCDEFAGFDSAAGAPTEGETISCEQEPAPEH